MRQKKSRRVCSEQICQYEQTLQREEKSANTISKYVRDIEAFFLFLENREVTKAELLLWKEQLATTHAPASVNSMLAAVNSFLVWLGRPELKVKPYKIQKVIYANPEKELTRKEYHRLVKAAEKSGNKRLSLLLQTICATGIRVSELKFITVESLPIGRATVECKGKRRTVFLPQDLCRILDRFCKGEHVEQGVIFRTKKGAPLDRSNIWKMMKDLCKSAEVEPGKVFPHNLRHLFARTYYSLEKDLSRLADLLGHSNVNTTKIYTMESGREHRRQLERMSLVMRT